MNIQDAIDAYLQEYRRQDNDQTPCQGFVRRLDGCMEQALVDLLVGDYTDLAQDLQYVMTRAYANGSGVRPPTVVEAACWVMTNKDELVGLLIQAIKEQRANW